MIFRRRRTAVTRDGAEFTAVEPRIDAILRQLASSQSELHFGATSLPASDRGEHKKGPDRSQGLRRGYAAIAVPNCSV